MRSVPTVPTLEPAFEIVCELEPPQDHGVTRRGHRRVVPILAGTLKGAGVPDGATAVGLGTGPIDAEILPGGADWQVVRADGSLEIDCRDTARTTEGEYLYLQVTGIRSGRPEVLESLLAGADVDPDDYYFRTTITIETAAPRLAALEHCVFVTSCVREANAVRYVCYRVS